MTSSSITLPPAVTLEAARIAEWGRRLAAAVEAERAARAERIAVVLDHLAALRGRLADGLDAVAVAAVEALALIAGRTAALEVAVMRPPTNAPTSALEAVAAVVNVPNGPPALSHRVTTPARIHLGGAAA